MELDVDACYRAVSSRDRRFDGVFYTAVRTTGIYCRPSCPARTPALANVTFHRSAAAAQAAGYRACKRCLPDATPGSPEWDVAATAAGRAMRLIADGVVDREGVEGLARRMGYTPRHLGRLLVAELGAGPLALARARRAQTARVLIETTSLGLTDVAFAAGFASVRQFNDTIREVYDATPSQLRGHRPHAVGGGVMQLRLAVRTPYAGAALLRFLADHAVPGVEVVHGATYARTLDLPHGPGAVELELADLTGPGTAFVPAAFRLTDLRDTGAAVERVRRILDADCDPVAVGQHLGADPVLGPLVAAVPGLRVPGAPDGTELAVRTIVGQQVSVAGARTVLGRLVAAYGVPFDAGMDGLTHVFPSAATIARIDPEGLPMPRARGRALNAVAVAIGAGEVALDRGADRDGVRAALLTLPGVGPWTADYIALRALAHPDVFLPSDVGLRRALARLGADDANLADVEAAWRPWRSYAALYLWNSLALEAP
jgi:AraC family transcriptional regulator of adaptative response / DNA-3-methyladenine glycosylase II